METAPPKSAASSAPGSPRPCKEARGPYRVMSFPGAGFDTVLQMGVIHALLVTRRRSPDLVTGISVGAITAAVVGEVLQADAESCDDARADDQARVARFSELLEAFRNAPSTVLKGLFPDPLETNAAHALKAVELPRHFKEERDSRQEAVNSRNGVIRLFNHLTRLRVSVKVFTQLTRVIMGWRSVTGANWRERWITRARLVFRGWFLVAANIFSLAMPASLVARVELFELLGINGRTQALGVEAGHIIFNRWAWLRAIRDHLLWFFLGFVPLCLGLLVLPVLLGMLVFALTPWELPEHLMISASSAAVDIGVILITLAGWVWLLCRKTIFRDLLKHFHIFVDLGDSYALKEALVENFDPGYYGQFRFDDNVRRALKQEKPSSGGCGNKKPLAAYAKTTPGSEGIRVVALAANLGTGRLEALPPETSVVDALMCANAVVPFFRAQSIVRNGVTSTFIDGTHVSSDPVIPAYEEACKELTRRAGDLSCSSIRIISASLLPLRQEKLPGQHEPFTGLVDVALRAQQLQRFQDMLLDKGLIDRLARALNQKPATVIDESGQKETMLPAKVRLVAPERHPDLSLRLMQAGSVVERRKLIDASVADGCRAMIERLVTDALPDTRTIEERRLLLEPDEEMPDEWPHRDPGIKHSLREAVEQLRDAGRTIKLEDGAEFVPCRMLIEAWGMKPLPGSDTTSWPQTEPGPGISEVCRGCIARHTIPGPGGEKTIELRQHLRLPRTTRTPFNADPKPVQEKKGPAVVFLFSGGVFRGVFQVGFSNAVSELGIQPDVIAGASVGTIIGALIGRAFQKPHGDSLVERQRQFRRLAATFLTIDRFVLTDRFADFVRHFSIHAASADFSLRDLDLVFRRYEKDSGFAFSRRARRVLTGMERLFYLSPFEMLELAQTLRAGNWQAAAKLARKFAQDMADRYGVGLELLGPEPLQQLIDGFVFDGRPVPGVRLDYFGFPLMGTTTNLSTGKLDILRSTNPWDPRFTQSLLAGSAFPMVFRPRWSWEVYRHPAEVAQYADGGIMDNLPLGAVVEYLWGKDSSTRYERRPEVPHLILTATLEPEKADWTHRDDLDKLGWADIRARAAQLRYNGKIDKFQQGQRDIRRILKQRASEDDADVRSSDLPMNLDVLAVKPQWLCGTFAFHPMLGFSRKNQADSIAHGCASTICAIADHFDPANKAHAIDVDSLRHWARGRGIALDQLPARSNAGAAGALAYGPAPLSEAEREQGACWFRNIDARTGRRPVCPFHPKSSACCEGDELGSELHHIYMACGRPETHQSKRT